MVKAMIPNDVLPGTEGTQPDYDGIGEDWFESAAAMQAAFASPEGQAVGADAAIFRDVTRLQVLVVAEEEVPLPVVG